MWRVSVVGNSGAGKSVLAARLARRLGVPHVELDAMFHLRGWTELPEADFRAQVALVTSGDGWVVDGNYAAVRDIVWDAADTVVWLAFPRRLVMARVIRRTAWRALLRRQLWNGNRERLRNLLSINPEQSVIAWSWVKHGEYLRRFGDAMSDRRWRHLRFIRVDSPRAADDLVRSARPSRPSADAPSHAGDAVDR